MNIRGLLLLVAIVLGLVGLGAAGLYFVRAKLELRVAAGPENGENWRFLGSVLQVFGENAARAKLKRVSTASDDVSGKAMETGAADLAIVRSDMQQPPNSATLAIVRRDFVFLITPAKSPIENLRQLEGKAIGMLPGPYQDGEALDRLMSYFAISPQAITRVALTPADAGNAIRLKRVAAIFVVGQPHLGSASEAFSSIAKATKATPEIIGIDGGDAIARAYPVFEAHDIPQGAFGGAKPQPDEATPTLSLTWRLIGKSSLPNFTAGIIARRLMESKGRLVGLTPLGTQIEAPETNKDQSFLVHPGAVAYYDDEETSIFDRFESLLWIGLAAASLLGSLGAWMWQKLRRPDAHDASHIAERLIDIVGLARGADVASVATLEDEYDGLVAAAIRARAAGRIEAEDASLLTLAFDQVRRALDARRRDMPAIKDEAAKPAAHQGAAATLQDAAARQDA